MHHQFSANTPVVQLAAQLEIVDAAVLLHFEVASDYDVTALCKSAAMESTPHGSLRLIASVREAALASVSLQQRCVAHERLEQAWRFAHAAYLRTADHAHEERCFGYMRLLAEEYLARRDIAAFQQLVEAASALKPSLAFHRQLLEAYELNVLSRRTTDRVGLAAQITAYVNDTNPHPSVQMRLYNTLGTQFFLLSHYESALQAYQQVEVLAHATDSKAYAAMSLINRSMIHNQLGRPGDLERALELLEQALVYSHTAHDVYREAHIRYELGHNFMLLGQWQQAQEHFSHADAFYCTNALIGDRPQVLWCQGLLFHLLGDHQASEACYRAILGLVPADDSTTVRLDTVAFLAFLLATRERFDEALGLYQEVLGHPLAASEEYAHELALIWYRYGDVLARIGRVDEAILAFKRAIEMVERLRHAHASEHFKLGILGSSQQMYEALVALLLTQGLMAEAVQYIERARSRAFLDQLEEKSQAVLARHEAQTVALAEIQAALLPETCLIEYFTTGVLLQNRRLLDSIPNPSLRAWLQQPQRLYIVAITSTMVQVAQSSLDLSILQPPSAAVNQNRLLQDALLIYLYQHLIAPVASVVQGNRLLYVVPHGPLHHVPFMALRLSRQRYLIDADGPAIAVTPSASVLFHTALNRPPSTNQALVAVGHNGPVDDRLTFAEAEATLLAARFAGMAFVGSDAHPAIIERGASARWLHVASHCRYNPQQPLESRVELEPALTAQAIVDAVSLDAEVVALSGCMSGVSHIVPGDEQLGLQRAMLYAGARSVLCTQWRTHDLVAPLVMERFFANLTAGMGAGLALKHALVAVRTLRWRDLEPILTEWSAQAPAFGLAELRREPAHLDDCPFAHPSAWATFLLVGFAG